MNNQILEAVQEIIAEISKSDLDKLEKVLDKLFARVNIDIDLSKKHFFERVNEVRGDGEITLKQIGDLFRKAFSKYGTKLSNADPDWEATLFDSQSGLNIPFVLEWNRKEKEFELIAKTAMRTKDFKTRIKLKV